MTVWEDADIAVERAARQEAEALLRETVDSLAEMTAFATGVADTESAEQVMLADAAVFDALALLKRLRAFLARSGETDSD